MSQPPGWKPDVHRRVALDTMCFIYVLEANPDFVEVSQSWLALVESGRVVGTASVLTATELLVHPLRAGRPDVAANYATHLRNLPNLDLVPIDLAIAREAAHLRARWGLRTPDALHLASAIRADVDVFVTADRQIARAEVGLDIVVLRPD